MTQNNRKLKHLQEWYFSQKSLCLFTPCRHKLAQKLRGVNCQWRNFSALKTSCWTAAWLAFGSKATVECVKLESLSSHWLKGVLVKFVNDLTPLSIFPFLLSFPFYRQHHSLWVRCLLHSLFHHQGIVVRCTDPGGTLTGCKSQVCLKLAVWPYMVTECPCASAFSFEQTGWE